MTKVKKIRAALVGCGGISGNHLSSVKNIADAEIVALCDIKRERAAACAEAFAPEAQIYTDYKVMLRECEIDCLHIATPHYLHCEMAVYALERGINVFLEKPMGISLDEIDKLVEAERKSTGKATVCFQNRFNPATVLAKAYADADGGASSGFGSVFWGRDESYYKSGDWRGRLATEGGGVLINQAIHTLDLLCYFIGKPQKVSATVENLHLRNIIEVEDTAAGIIEFEGGKSACFNATTAHFGYDATVLGFKTKNHRIEIIGDRLYIDGKAVDTGSLNVLGKECYGGGHSEIIAKFYEAIRCGGNVPVTLESASYSLLLLLGAYMSCGEKIDI